MFSMIYLWLIGAVVLAGADILLGTIYLLIIAVAALAAFIFAVIGEELGFTGVSREVDGGAAVLLEMPLNAKKKLSRLVLETLSNEVVIGIMGITLQQ